MIKLDYDLTLLKENAIKVCSGYVADELPEIPDNLDFNEVGFRALPQLIKKTTGAGVMAHNEAGYIMSKMCVNPDRNYDEYIDRILTVKRAEEESGKSRFIAVDDFSISAMVRLYALYRGKVNISEEKWEQVRKALLEVEYAPYFEPMSENHKLCFMSSELVAAQLFGDGVFYDGLDGNTRLPIIKNSLYKFLEKHLKRGWSEYDSTSYYEINFMSLINLYDFAQDDKLRKLASDLMNTMSASLFIHSANGYAGGPKGRVYPNVMENPEIGVYSIINLAAPAGKFVNDSTQVTGMMYMATSSFMFDEEVAAIVEGKTESNFEVKDSVGLYTIPDDLYIKGRIYKYFYKGDGYCMGCVAGRDNPYENVAYTWLCGHQEQAWSLTIGKNPKASIYSSHPGNPDMYDYGMHGVWAGDCNCLCQKFVQDKNLLLCYWDIKDKNQLQYIHIYFPEAEFEKVEYGKNTIVAAIGDVALRICINGSYSKNTEGAYANREIIVDSSRGCFAVEVFSGENSYEAALIINDLPQLSENGAKYRNLEIKDDNTYINGKPFDKSEYKLYNSPYLESEYDSGKITLTYNGSKKVYGI